jgi:23S rRNA (guanosine2251-2'-O)-methyltransferase
VYYLIDKHPNKIQKLYLAKEVEKKEYSRLMKMGFEISRIPENAAISMSKSGNHQGFLAEVDDYKFTELSKACKGNFVLVLSSITDVGNIGAIVRSAYALGVDSVIITGLKNLNLEPIARSSSGALFDMPIVFEHNIFDVINELKLADFQIYGAVVDGVDIKEVPLSYKRALVLGSEGDGLSQRVLKKLTHKVSIKMSHEFDSLNVSAAGAILIDRMR